VINHITTIYMKKSFFYIFSLGDGYCTAPQPRPAVVPRGRGEEGVRGHQRREGAREEGRGEGGVEVEEGEDADDAGDGGGGGG
jgi:hypothetical protein